MQAAHDSFSPDLWAVLAAILLVVLPVVKPALDAAPERARFVAVMAWVLVASLDAIVLAQAHDSPLLRAFAGGAIALSASALGWVALFSSKLASVKKKAAIA